MPGISLISAGFIDKHKITNALKDINSGYDSSSKILYHDDNFAVTITVHDSYPYWFFENDDIVIVFEGMVYNVHTEKIKEDIISISLKDEDTIKNYLHNMINTVDGDYLIVIYNKHNNKCFIFNDYFGRLPSFYSIFKDTFILTREYKFILHFLPEIIIDRHGLAAFLLWEHKLGNVTLIKNIIRMDAASLIENQFDTTNKQCNTDIKIIEELNFDVTEPIYNTKKCAEHIASHILTSIKNRHDTCTSHGLRCTCEVSGGFDTRTVLMGLEHLNLDADYYTHGVPTGDESRTAKALGAAYNKEVKSIYDSQELEADMHRRIYATDCMGNLWSAAASWNLSHIKRSQINGKAASFMGFGGEYFRHPVAAVPGFHSLNDMFRANVINILVYPEWAGYLSGFEKGEYTEYLADYFDSYPEQTFEGKLKKLDYEFHKIHNAGEDRTRALFWTVTPLLGLDVLKFLKRHFPQKLASYSFHIEVLKNIGSEGLHVPIHGRWIKPDSDFNVKCYDSSRTMISNLRKIIMSTSLHEPWKKIRGIRNKQKNQEIYNKLTRDLFQAHDELSLLSEYIPRERIENITKNIIGISYDFLYFYRILSVLIYFKELENRFMDKLVVE